ncbi:galactoside alpha-(1,2)-fucosyltransferase 1-like [Schistocerca nitens]|uniref:galactoside alpha-(1,2)-fucosyltransferase 1-like n=1 Tax=Schistocerca nitens TaxID=7011 RepID=UPI002117B208|nr:galactoside alpha-(1,2)-fucosyltransferase 1-like [Schistocerca nitens]
MVAALVPTRRAAVVWALATSVSLLLMYRCYQEEFSLLDTVIGHATGTDSSRTGPAAVCLEGVVTVQPGGRLGNLVLEYASAAAVARHHHLQLAVPSNISTLLAAVFDNLTADPLSVLLQQPPCRGQNLTENKVLNDEQRQPPHPLTVEEMVRWAQSRHMPVILSRWIILADYIVSSLDFLRQELRFRAVIQDAANKKLDNITSETAHKTGFNKTQVCTVGVHVRRTDYGPYMRKRFHLQQEAGPAYYEAAAAAMLADLHSECAAVAFAVTSDDSRWCQQHLLPVLSRKASADAAASVGFLVSSKRPADDLCLLSSCQHLIMAYGTFGLTAAILSGGRTIMYDTAHHGAHPLPAAQMMTSLVPQWRLIP